VKIGPGAICVIDSQWGSCGKGKVEGALYQKFPEIQVGVSDNMPNAGHTVYDLNGEKRVLKALPIACALGRTGVLGPHAAFYETALVTEWNWLAPLGGVLYVDPLASTVQQADMMKEDHLVNRIASTGQGGGNAQIRKVERLGLGTFAKDVKPTHSRMMVMKTAVYNQMIASRAPIMLEGSQGFDLSLNHGHQYPHVTSRDVTPNRMLDNAGLSPFDCREVIGVVRTFPIRVGDVGEFSSGPFYDDQQELAWSDVSAIAGKEVMETTTVTKRVRRVFSFSKAQFTKFERTCRPTRLFVTFGDYLPGNKLGEFIDTLNSISDAPVMGVSYGPKSEDTEWL
jgi:adenylosuccinate synthase